MKIRVLFLLLAASFLLGCGKGVPNAPSVTANAGEDQTVFINLQCELDGSASTGTPESFSWSVKTLPSGVSSLTIVSSGEKKAFFTPSASGAYEFTLSVQKGEDFSEDTVKYTVVPFSKASIDSGFYGVCAHLSSHDGSTEADLDAHINSLQDIGAQFVRFDFDWEDIEPSNDRFDFSKYDSIAAKLKAKNIKILGVLDYGNLWCDPTTGETSAINKFADFAYNAAKHFKLNIKLWEIWNEPNNPFFWTTTSAEAYTRLLKASYGAVKQADPAATVVLGGLFGNGKDSVYLTPIIILAQADFLEDIYNAGGGNYFDVVSIHPYDSAKWTDSTATLEAAIEATKGIMNTYGDSTKELWLTELGPYYFPPSPVAFISQTGYTESQEASWVNLIYTNLKSKCDKLFFYELRDYPGSGTLYNPNWEGLMYFDYRTKEAYGAYKSLVK